jgi:GT2 family glycosyltransferase
MSGRGAGFVPRRVVELELGEPLPALSELALGYARALCVVRLHGQPMGLVDVAVGEAAEAAGLAAAVWAALGAPINAHRAADGEPPLAGLPAEGLGAAGEPRCRAGWARPDATAPLVSVIVATHERPADLARCLEALAGQRYARYEVLVVDNAPRTGATAALVQARQASWPQLRYLREDRPGQALAQNTALAEARGEIVAFTDDDAVVDPDWLAALVAAFAAGPDVGCVTGLVLPLELETPAQLWFEQYGGFGRGWTRRVYDLAARGVADRVHPMAVGRFGTGANMAFRRDVLAAIGGFDARLGPGSLVLGAADLAAFFDVLIRGYQVVYEPAALVYHAHRRDYAALRGQIYTWGVGFTAFVTRALLARPRLGLVLVRELLKGLPTALTLRAQRNRQLLAGWPRQLAAADYPRELRVVELLGRPYGPLAYLRSWWRCRTLLGGVC